MDPDMVSELDSVFGNLRREDQNKDLCPVCGNGVLEE
jgi:hypothetical protein